MKPTLRFHGTVNGGKLKLDHPDSFKNYVETLDGKVTLSLKVYKRGRTINQNSLYWVYLNVLEQETGDSANNLHEFLKRKLLNPRFVKVMGEDIKLPATTTNLDTTGFSEYMERIEQLTGIPIPTPEYL